LGYALAWIAIVECEHKSVMYDTRWQLSFILFQKYVDSITSIFPGKYSYSLKILIGRSNYIFIYICHVNNFRDVSLRYVWSPLKERTKRALFLPYRSWFFVWATANKEVLNNKTTSLIPSQIAFGKQIQIYWEFIIAINYQYIF